MTLVAPVTATPELVEYIAKDTGAKQNMRTRKQTRSSKLVRNKASRLRRRYKAEWLKSVAEESSHGAQPSS